ncbi:hypothetical protein NQ314_007088 [Rhamnusium bicolor]|uniref:Uncharacterized protein n=1 Tax=Rhamnusium bicolor TaxID=1586634 RepID=A0AAV8YUS1_9CUCU|nr:hypothetical protein NQ314_007088 [Rhamnusium bicolor]
MYKARTQKLLELAVTKDDALLSCADLFIDSIENESTCKNKSEEERLSEDGVEENKKNKDLLLGNQSCSSNLEGECSEDKKDDNNYVLNSDISSSNDDLDWTPLQENRKRKKKISEEKLHQKNKSKKQNKK